MVSLERSTADYPTSNALEHQSKKPIAVSRPRRKSAINHLHHSIPTCVLVPHNNTSSRLCMLHYKSFGALSRARHQGAPFKLILYGLQKRTKCQQRNCPSAKHRPPSCHDPFEKMNVMQRDASFTTLLPYHHGNYHPTSTAKHYEQQHEHCQILPGANTGQWSRRSSVCGTGTGASHTSESIL